MIKKIHNAIRILPVKADQVIKANTVPIDGKDMASVLWDMRGDYIKQGEAMDGVYYANLLQRLSNEMKKKQPQLAKKKALFH